MDLPGNVAGGSTLRNPIIHDSGVRWQGEALFRGNLPNQNDQRAFWRRAQNPIHRLDKLLMYIYTLNCIFMHLKGAAFDQAAITFLE